LGGKSVSRLLVAPESEPKVISSTYASFKEQANARRIVVVSGDKLRDLESVLRKESSDNPTFLRG